MSLIAVFDEECLLCNRMVRFLLRHDRDGTIWFASMQGETGRRLLAAAGLAGRELDTLLVVEGDASWTRTAALFRLLHALGWPWRIAWAAWLIPAPLRDAAYRWIARNRRRLFGRASHCELPIAAHRRRFLP